MIEIDISGIGGISTDYYHNLLERLNDEVTHADISKLSSDELRKYVALYATFQYESAVVDYIENDYIGKNDIEVNDKIDRWQIALDEWDIGDEELLLKTIEADFSFFNENDEDLEAVDTWNQIVALVREQSF